MLGTLISHYRVTGKLGTGGMGVVYEAEDTRLPRKVALKFLPEELAGDPDAARRSRREAETIALLNHPHICTIYDLGQSHGRSFIAMERCDGVSLKVARSRAMWLSVMMASASALACSRIAGLRRGSADASTRGGTAITGVLLAPHCC